MPHHASQFPKGIKASDMCLIMPDLRAHREGAVGQGKKSNTWCKPARRSVWSNSRMVQIRNHSSKARSSAGEEEFVITLVAADKRCRSWREKLDLVHGLLAGENALLTTGQLVDTAIYLRFLGTGEIPCAEDGRHFRPGHHARIALDIYKRLAAKSDPQIAWLVRRILP